MNRAEAKQQAGSPPKRCFLTRLERWPGEGHAEAAPAPSPRDRIEPDQALEPVPVAADSDEERPHVVAEILSDGTVQVLDRASEARATSPWESGVISGRGWTVWWERRRWA